MKKAQLIKQERDCSHEEQELEILKAVAQAWHGHSAGSKNTTAAASEFDARPRRFKGGPSRFKIESTGGRKNERRGGPHVWDFGQSLWDSYEIVSVSKKLERGLVMMDEYPFSDGHGKGARRPRESRNSLRSLFNRVASRRFSAADLPSE